MRDWDWFYVAMVALGIVSVAMLVLLFIGAAQTTVSVRGQLVP